MRKNTQRLLPRRPLAAAALVAAALTLTACAGSGDGSTEPTATRAAPPPAATTQAGEQSAPPAAQVPQTLQFTSPTVDGQTFDGATLAGKPAVLWFWAAWCTRCNAAADEVAATAQENSGRVNFVGVAGLRSGEGAMRDFVDEHGLDVFPNLADDSGEVWRKFDVTSQEYYVIIDSAGEVVHSGPMTTDDLRQRVAGLA